MNEIYLALAGAALGFSLVIPPGPMNVLIANRSMRSLRAGITTGLGAMAADGVLGTIVYAVHATIQLGAWVRWIEGAGALVLSGMVYRLLRERPAAESVPSSDVRVFTVGLIVGVTNPFQIIWWVTAGLAFAYVGGAVLFVGLFAAIGVWVVVFPALLTVGARTDPRIPRVVSIVSAVVLGGFAAYFALVAVGVPL
ncbi:MAG: LysE family transporter [Thermoplasmata archaeon]|nr:LysE family transporter [Thermoplasmata archaeon]